VPLLKLETTVPLPGKMLKDSLGIANDRVYLNFTDVEAENWVWNGSTFG